MVTVSGPNKHRVRSWGNHLTVTAGTGRYWLLCGLLAACYLYRTVAIPLPSLGPAISDFWWYHQAAQAVLSGDSPYSVEDFAYPPLFAFLLTPLALVSYETARWIWFALSHGCLFLSAYLLWRVAGGDRLALLAVVGVWTFGGAIAESLMLGQINPLLLLLVAFSWYLPPRLSAASVAAAAAVKIWPGTLLGSYAVLRQGRAFAAGVAMLAVLAALPWVLIALLLGPPSIPPATHYWMGTPAVFNFSAPAIALRILDRPTGTGRLPANWEFGNSVHALRVPEPDRWVAVAVAAGILAAGLAALFWRAGPAPSDTPLPLVSGAIVALTLAASPVSWSHYQLLQYPGAALLLARLLRRREFRRATVLGGLFLGLYQIPILGLGPYLATYGWTAANPPLLWALTSLTPLCSLVLFAVYLRELRVNSV
jgi:alpha-1,2-mannosyltransferase